AGYAHHPYLHAFPTRRSSDLPVFSANFDPANLENLNGFRPLPPEWGFEWKFFFELGGNPSGKPMQKAYRIDQQLVNPLGNLPPRSEEHTSELQSRVDVVCRLL